MTAHPIKLSIDGDPIEVAAGTSVAAAVLNLALRPTRRSVHGDRRAPLCGMGTCFECRVTIDGQPHLRSCMIPCTDGMVVQTDVGEETR